MSKETVTLRVEVFRDKDGDPTCCAKWNDKMCVFLSVTKFGTAERCDYTGEPIHRGPFGSDPGDIATHRDMDYLRPGKNCPLWSKAKEQ